MRLGIASDIHLGINKFRKMINMQNVYSDLNNKSFNEAVDIFNSQNVDTVLIAGDLFENPNPSVLSLKIARNGFKSLGKTSYLSGGNHEFSQKNNIIECHPFDLIDSSNVVPIYDEVKVLDFDCCDITFIPYKFLDAETYSKIYKGKLKDKIKTSILVFHGVVDLNNSNDIPEYYLPKEVAANYDLVICGHTHLNRLLKTESTSILTPGSLMPSNQANHLSGLPGVWIYDTVEKTIKKFELETPPKVKEIVTSDVNGAFETIINDKNANNIYSIKYNGKLQDVDEYLYKKAVGNSLNLSLQTNEQTNSLEVKEVTNFWGFVSEKCPEYLDEFKTILKGE